MATQVGYEAIILQKRDASRLASLSFQIRRRSFWARPSKSCMQQNLEVARRTALNAGDCGGIEFTDPTGTRVQLFAECDVDQGKYAGRGVRASKIGQSRNSSPT